jgi:hypothetical protein
MALTSSALRIPDAPSIPSPAAMALSSGRSLEFSPLSWATVSVTYVSFVFLVVFYPAVMHGNFARIFAGFSVKEIQPMSQD